MFEAALENDFGFDEYAAADELRQRKAASVSEDAPLNKGGEGGLDGTGEKERGGMSLRERVMSALRAEGKKDGEKSVTVTKLPVTPASLATGRLLKQSWINLIDSFGLTLIYINIHVFLKAVLGEKLFCGLGYEWVPLSMWRENPKIAESTAKKLGLVEVIVLLIVDLIVFFLIFMALAQIVIIIKFVSASWLDKLKFIYDAFNSLGWGAVSAIGDLFRGVSFSE